MAAEIALAAAFVLLVVLHCYNVNRFYSSREED